MNIIVTGGAGFIGSAVIRYLIQNTEHNVINVDKLTYAGNLASLKDIERSPNYVFMQSDICDTSHMDEIFETVQPDLVMHLAAESHVDRSIEGSAEFIHTNILGPIPCLRLPVNTGKKAKKKASDSIIFQLTKFTATLRPKTLPLLKRQPMHQAHLIQQVKPALTIWSVRGAVRTVCLL